MCLYNCICLYKILAEIIKFMALYPNVPIETLKLQAFARHWSPPVDPLSIWRFCTPTPWLALNLLCLHGFLCSNFSGIRTPFTYSCYGFTASIPDYHSKPQCLFSFKKSTVEIYFHSTSCWLHPLGFLMYLHCHCSCLYCVELLQEVQSL